MTAVLVVLIVAAVVLVAVAVALTRPFAAPIADDLVWHDADDLAVQHLLDNPND